MRSRKPMKAQRRRKEMPALSFVRKGHRSDRPSAATTSSPDTFSRREPCMSNQAAETTEALDFLRRPNSPRAPRPEPKSTRAAGSGVVAACSDI
jgi:hypothetical protein